MTRKQNTQLSNRYFLLALAFLVLLLLTGYFFYALCRREDLLFSLAGSLFVSILFLIPLRYYLEKRRAFVDLEKQDYIEKANLLASEIAKEKEVLEFLQEKIIKYSQLKGLTEQLSLCPSLEETSRTLSREVNTLLGGRAVTTTLYLFQSHTGELEISFSRAGTGESHVKSKKGGLFDQWVVKTMQPLLVEDTQSDYRFDIDKFKAGETRGVRSLISAPLIVGRKAVGILRVDSPKSEHFLTEDLRFLTTIGDLGAIAIENARLYEKLKDLAIKDSLTGLYLRRYLLDRFDGEISREMRRKKELSFLMIDLDNFKTYNDQFGHAAGDIVLKTVSTVLGRTFKKPGDLIARYGGEEFSVLLPDCPKKQALELAEQFRKTIASETITLRREKTSVTVSIGVSTFPHDAQSKDELIIRADQALYKAKTKGRNRVFSV